MSKTYMELENRLAEELNTQKGDARAAYKVRMALIFEWVKNGTADKHKFMNLVDYVENARVKESKDTSKAWNEYLERNGFTPEDLAGPLHELHGAFIAGAQA